MLLCILSSDSSRSRNVTQDSNCTPQCKVHMQVNALELYIEQYFRKPSSPHLDNVNTGLVAYSHIPLLSEEIKITHGIKSRQVSVIKDIRLH